jgi:7-keto-8-aminopelargonate synthetase-like enzyme
LEAHVNEFVELADWFGWRAPRDCLVVDSLPIPAFQMKNRQYVSFSTNNYLGLATSPRMRTAAIRGIEAYGVGNSDSRLLGGNLALYGELERKIARSKGKSHAILFATGYLTNLGVLSTLPRATQTARGFGFSARREYSYAYFGDEYNHISIREGIRLSGARRYTYRHLDLDHLEKLLRQSAATSKIIVTDGVFSQDGDIAPIPDLIDLAARWDAMLYVDDAHGTGVLGASGGGVLEHFNTASERLIYMGTLSKAYGSIGGYVAADELITEVLRMTCPAYGFTATLPPDQAMVISAAIDVVRDEPERRQRLWDNQRHFVALMRNLDYKLISTQTPIVPIWLGDEAKADSPRRRDPCRCGHVSGSADEVRTHSNPTQYRPPPRGHRSSSRGVEAASETRQAHTQVRAGKRRCYDCGVSSSCALCQIIRAPRKHMASAPSAPELAKPEPQINKVNPSDLPR